ncbi:MAG: hypothetical protein JWM59_4990 [Verrucomicrobiales bacterium]|nr:hypothetical protein [Verrucomicrobiales bacterium]
MSDPYTSGIPPVPPENPYTPPGTDPVPVDTTVTIETKIKAMICHLMFVVGPLIVWYLRRDGTAFLEHHGKEALNFQITVILAVMVCIILAFVVIGALLMPVVSIAAGILTLLAALGALDGKYYRYPFALRLIK